MNGKLKSILTSVVALTLIAAIATAALAGTNALTADTIRENAEATANAARRTVIAADDFTARTLSTESGEVAYYEAVKDGAVVGYVFTVTTTGKSAGLTVMTGVSTTGEVTGVTVTAENETAGYVKKVTNGGLFAALTGVTSTDGVDTVSQATKTSKGVLRAVDTALDYYKALG